MDSGYIFILKITQCTTLPFIFRYFDGKQYDQLARSILRAYPYLMQDMGVSEEEAVVSNDIQIITSCQQSHFIYEANCHLFNLSQIYINI